MISSVELANPKISQALEDNGFHLRELPRTSYLIHNFPYYNPLSILIGVLKVYPMAKKLGIIKSACLEFIYDGAICFAFPQSNLTAFEYEDKKVK